MCACAWHAAPSCAVCYSSYASCSLVATRATCTSGVAVDARATANGSQFDLRMYAKLFFGRLRQQTSRGEHDRYGKQCLREASCVDPSSAHCTGGRIAVFADRMEADTSARATMGLFVGVGCLEAAYRERCSCRSDRAVRCTNKERTTNGQCTTRMALHMQLES